MRIALVSREVAPMVGGGIATYISALATLLSREAEVTILTTEAVADELERARAQGHPSLPAPEVRIELVEQPTERGTWLHDIHAYSANVLRRLKELYPDGGPDLVEIPDYNGEGAAIVQAARTRDPALRRTTLVTRIHTTAEICDVLNLRLRRDVEQRALYELERYSLRFADRVLYGGGDILGTYQRFFGADTVAPARRVPHPVQVAGEPAPPPPGPGDGEPLRLLYLGRFERRKGVENLIRALSTDATDRWRLTMVGGDTETGSLRVPMREQIRLMAGDDPRIDIREAVDRAEVGRLLAAHHAVILPSLWECWPNVALEALCFNRPVIATPVGGLREIAAGQAEGIGGLLARGTEPADLWEVIERVLRAPQVLHDAIAAEEPLRRFAELAHDDEIAGHYLELAAERPRERSRRRTGIGAEPLVSVVVPYFRLEAYVRQTVESALAQTHRRLEVIVVNDGSLRPEDAVLDQIAALPRVRVVTQPNSGLGAARNAGIALARGRYVVPLDADDILEPEFVARAVEVLESDPDVAYVSCWTRYVHEDLTPIDIAGDGFSPYGNCGPLVHEINTAGHATALFRRRLFDLGFRYSTDLTSFEDWMLYRDLHDAGYVGHVIPERLMRYRVRTRSMLRGVEEQRRLWLEEETASHRIRRNVAWTP